MPSRPPSRKSPAAKFRPAIERQRAQLEDAMVDCQFQLGGARVAVAADPDLLAAIVGFLTSLGAEVVAAVASARADHLSQLPIDSVVIGDLEDFEWLAREQGAELIVTNSHGAGDRRAAWDGVPARRFSNLRLLRRPRAKLVRLRRHAARPCSTSRTCWRRTTRKSRHTAPGTGKERRASLKPWGAAHVENRVRFHRPRACGHAFRRRREPRPLRRCAGARRS